MTEPKTILIIEDDVDMVEAMKLVLGTVPYQVLSAERPDEGMRLAKTAKPDLIILDVMFGSKGETQGFDCAQKMKQDKALAAIPILMVTSVNVTQPGFGFTPEKDGEYLPVDDFIDKPAQPDDLLQKTAALLERKTSVWVNWPEKQKV